MILIKLHGQLAYSFFFYQFISGDRFFRIAQLENLYKMFVTFLVFGKRNTHVFFLSFLNFVIGPIDMSCRLNGAGSTHKARFNWYKLMFWIWFWSWVLWMNRRIFFLDVVAAAVTAAIVVVVIIFYPHFVSLYLAPFYFPDLQWHYLHCIFRFTSHHIDTKMNWMRLCR